MVYTKEDYKWEVARELLQKIPPNERREVLDQLPADERLRGPSTEQIETYLKALRKQAATGGDDRAAELEI